MGSDDAASLSDGGMRERTNRTVSKTVVSQGTVGSNPTPSAGAVRSDNTDTHIRGEALRPLGPSAHTGGRIGGRMPRGPISRHAPALAAARRSLVGPDQSRSPVWAGSWVFSRGPTTGISVTASARAMARLLRASGRNGPVTT